MVALDLMGVSGLDELGEMAKDLYPLPFCVGIKDVSEVGEVCDICVVLNEVPAVELELAVFFP